MTQMDVITYAGEINLKGYQSICETLANKKSETALLVLATPGGDPHQGFRIARALQYTYGQFDALVPRFCKSAGTLIVIGAKRLYLDDMSELGPLDVQVKKSDEVIGRNSGLDILQAVNYLHLQAMTAFRGYLLELTRDAGLSTKVASDISSKLTTGLYEPVFAQLDPMKLAEMQRALEIAHAYGTRLNEKSGNLKDFGLNALVSGYPSHGFVIDRKEARQLFIDVQKPTQVMADLSKALHAEMEKNTYNSEPSVNLYSLPIPTQGETHEATSNSSTSAASDEAGHATLSRDSEIESIEQLLPAGQAAQHKTGTALNGGSPAETA